MGKIPILLMEVWEMVCFYFLFFIITFFNNFKVKDEEQRDANLTRSLLAIVS